MKAYCTRCKKITDFQSRIATVRSGDRGFAQEESWYCTECQFTPFLKPEEIKG